MPTPNHGRPDSGQILVWGKTYPELSARHRETVCTGGTFVETGRPVRLYPISLRYLDAHKQYSLYDIIEVPTAPSSKDTRPESRKVTGSGLNIVRSVPTDGDWAARHRIVFMDTSWHFDCLDLLKAAHARDRTSLGLIPVRTFDAIEVEERPRKERDEHDAKLKKLKEQTEIFAPATKHLDFLPWRFRVRWHCKASGCRGHHSLVLDWGLGELARRLGADAAVQKMEQIGDPVEHDLRFFMGNYKAHPQHYGVVGLWYPKRTKIEAALSQGSLF